MQNIYIIYVTVNYKILKLFKDWYKIEIISKP